MPEEHTLKELSQYLLNFFHNTGNESIIWSLMKIVNFNNAVPNEERGHSQSYRDNEINKEFVERRLSLEVTFRSKNKNLN